jgi:hypothetical protein
VLVALLAVCLLGLGVLILEGLMRRALEKRGLAGPPINLSGLEELTAVAGVSFPETAKLLGGEYLRGMNPYLIARVSVPAGDLDAFLTKNSLLQTTFTDHKAFYDRDVPEMGVRGWSVDSIRQFVSAQEWRPSRGELVRIVVDLDDSESAVIYVWWVVL